MKKKKKTNPIIDPAESPKKNLKQEYRMKIRNEVFHLQCLYDVLEEAVRLCNKVRDNETLPFTEDLKPLLKEWMYDIEDETNRTIALEGFNMERHNRIYYLQDLADTLKKAAELCDKAREENVKHYLRDAMADVRKEIDDILGIWEIED